MPDIDELERQIIRHKILYYKGTPEISDQEYDDLELKLKKIHPQSPVLNMVGTMVQSPNRIMHSKKMLSLDKTYDLTDLIKWVDKKAVVSIFKIDGVSCSLIYTNGQLTVAKTRGDGTYGEDIMSKVLWIEDIPKKVSEKLTIEIRGELYCTEKDFFLLSQEMEKAGFSKPTSQRNIVSGLMGRKENLEFSRYIKFFAFDLIEDNFRLENEVQKLQKIESLNFSVPSFTLHTKEETLSSSIKEAQEFMADGDYLIDGLVLTYNDLHLHEELGNTSHHPRYRMSYKFQGISKETSILDIEWNVSRNGILTPVAHVTPVELGSAQVSRVTLHNYGMVVQYELKAGDVIEIIRSGEVIPKFLSVKKSASGHLKIPETCPSCGSAVVIEEIRLRCTGENCPGRLLSSILNFVQKIGIEDLSDKRLEEMIKVGLVENIDDLYRVTIEDLLKLNKTKEKLAKKIFENIQKTKKVNLVTFLSSLGLTGGAYNKCEKIIQAGFNSLAKIKKLKFDDLVQVDSFAEKSAEDFLKSLTSKIDLIEKLEDLGFEIEASPTLKSETLAGKRICITGALSMKRSEIEKLIREHGGNAVSSVNKSTDLLITNEENSESSKFKAATKFKIPIMNEEAFLKLISS